MEMLSMIRNLSDRNPGTKQFRISAIKIILASIVMMLVFSDLSIKAQDAGYSQFFSTPTYYNPGYVGLTLGMKTRMNFRKMYNNIPGDNYTYNLSLDIADRNIPGSGGIGVIFNQNREGLGYIKAMTAGFMPSVRIPLSYNAIIQVGAMAAIVTREIDWDGMVFPDQLDPRWGNIGPSSFINPSSNKVIYPDFSFGTVFQFTGNNVTGTIGAAAHHLMEPNQSFLNVNAPLARRYVGHFDLIIDVEDYEGYYTKTRSFKVNPGIMYQNQAGMNIFNLGVNMYMSHIYLGVWYRNEVLEFGDYSNLTFLAGLHFDFSENTRMKMLYSYDMAIHSSHNFTGPSHEMSLIFEFDDIKFFRPNEIRGMGTSNRQFSPLECSPF